MDHYCCSVQYYIHYVALTLKGTATASRCLKHTVCVATTLYLNETSKTKICYFDNVAVTNKNVSGS